MYPSGSTTWFPLALSSLALLAYAVRRRILWMVCGRYRDAGYYWLNARQEGKKYTER